MILVPKIIVSKDEIVKRLGDLRQGRSVPNAPKGLPEMLANDTDKGPDGVYRSEGLADPGFLNWITGTGAGREL